MDSSRENLSKRSSSVVKIELKIDTIFMQDVINYTLSVLQVIFILMLPVSSFYSQTVKNNGSWKKYDIRILSFSAPSELVLEPFEGDDSEVWKYTSPKLELTIDYGLYSEKNAENKSEDNYAEKPVNIDNREATIVFFKFNDSNSSEFKYVAVVYFTAIGSEENKLSFVAYCKTPKEQKIAEKIFSSIRFKN